MSHNTPVNGFLIAVRVLLIGALGFTLVGVMAKVAAGASGPFEALFAKEPRYPLGAAVLLAVAVVLWDPNRTVRWLAGSLLALVALAGAIVALG